MVSIHRKFVPQREYGDASPEPSPSVHAPEFLTDSAKSDGHVLLERRRWESRGFDSINLLLRTN
jgi:hypothetical protein